MTAAAERVELSRARLRNAMTPPVQPPRKPLGTGNYGWLLRLKKLPGIGVVVDAVDSWWMHHPLRPMTRVVGQASSAAVQPLAQSNPISLVAGAAVAGAVLAWSRPWRWLLKPALFAGLVPQIASRIVAHLPLDALVASLDTPAPRR